MKINKEKMNKIINKVKENKRIVVGSAVAITTIFTVKSVKTHLKKEKGVPEGYENDVKNIVNECDWIVMAQ